MTEWIWLETEGAPAKTRVCDQLAVVSAPDRPALDLCNALPQVDDFSLASYGKTRFAVLLGAALERSAGVSDLGGIRKLFRLESARRRTAVVQGEIVIANGRNDLELAGGAPRLLLDGRRWEVGELRDMPTQVKRLRELAAAGVDAVELPTNPAVDLKFGRLNLAQPVVICRDRFRQGEATGRVRVRWSS